MGWIIYENNKDEDKIVYIDIDSIDLEFEKMIDSYIVDICYNDDNFSIKKVKKRIKKFMDRGDLDRKIGLVAEFFIHLFLNSIDLKQECLFFNLEEDSFKKGFDGVYKDADDTVWFMESKSGNVNTCTHKIKIQEAYRDLKNKFSNETSNDPWINAYNHLKCVDPTDSLLDKFIELSEDFDDGRKHDISEYNIIPCGTVFDDKNTHFKSDEIIKDIENYFYSRKYNRLFSICVTQRMLKEFERYLDK